MPRDVLIHHHHPQIAVWGCQMKRPSDTDGEKLFVFVVSLHSIHPTTIQSVRLSSLKQCSMMMIPPLLLVLTKTTDDRNRLLILLLLHRSDVYWTSKSSTRSRTNTSSPTPWAPPLPPHPLSIVDWLSGANAKEMNPNPDHRLFNK